MAAMYGVYKLNYNYKRMQFHLYDSTWNKI